MSRRQVLVSAAAALLPFAVLAVFTWARDGRPAGLTAMLGRGDLLPATAVLAAQALAGLLARPGRPPAVRTALGWTVFATACALFPLPYAGGTAYEGRLTFMSLSAFGAAVLVGLTSSAQRGRHSER